MSSMSSAINDDKETVHATFREECRVLETTLDQLRAVSADERPVIIEQCLAGIGHLSDLLKDAASYLPAYDQRAYSLKVKSLSDQLSEIRVSLAPKQKFSFKSRRSNAPRIGGTIDIGSSPVPMQPKNDAQKAASEQENLVITDKTSQHLRPTSATTAASASLLLSSIEGCVVTLPDLVRFSSAAIKNVETSLILLGDAVNGPVHLTNVSNSVLAFSCRQFRMHDAKNVDVYLHCTSRPIIEDCEDIRFHRYGTDSGNMWDKVDDFKWLRNEKSPHWRALANSELGSSGQWKEIRDKNIGELDLRATLDALLRNDKQ